MHKLWASGLIKTPFLTQLLISDGKKIDESDDP